MKNHIKSLSIFCGSSMGNQAAYRDSAERMADCLVDSNINLVYGGSTVGLMGIIADRVLSRGGKAIGVIPQSLADLEISHQGLTELHIVQSMHERKALLSELSQGAIMLPGGAGSLDEFFEFFTHAQLGFHRYPCGILNSDHYYDRLLEFLDHSVHEGFLKEKQRNMILVEESPGELLRRILTYEAPTMTKWVDSPQLLSC
jgi:uncharacterized protein (TIGR00730 family)